ncbi:cytochrome P450 [Amycolatopsis rubida]|uniref:Cytochrome P450 n=1 Tax=Amycolatopsis rubida TaxID=112413 RepID=A0ABX0C267_9PSEU|nr:MULTISPECIES: cytochrome P450 [Amycolatopsis]MYW94151.1 cytochrome P450 [Amycolatopsis rubida]NEC59140.1 cytochrome P450 [Amycolatopsis rubida]OAP20934.1 Pentalenene oxygenase [Amycolatopsis sp. M39]
MTAGPRDETGAVRAVPPGPPRRATLRLLKQLFTDRLALMGDSAEDYGDLVRIAIGPKTLYLVNHPDLAKHVLADNAANYHKGIGLREARQALGDGLLTSDGETWHRQRRTIQPAFQPKRIARQAGLVASEAAGLVERLAAHEGPVDILQEMTGLTLGVLGKTLLDADLGGYGALGHSFEAVQDQAMFEAITLGAVPRWAPLKKQVRFRAARDELRRIADELVDRRLANPVDGGEDVLSRLVGSETADGASREGMRDELITLLLAGHETTASTLGWAFHLVDEHPEVSARLHAEAVEVLGDRLPGYDDLRRLTYTTAVVEEVMRLYPPVWLLPRVAQADDEIGGYRVPAGSDVVVVPYTLHRHPGFWADPERFDPGRFDPAGPGGRPLRYAYLPFGAGPRFCVGNSLGLLEAVFVLAMTARDLELRKVPGRPVEPEAMLSLRVRGGLPMTVRPRPARERRAARLIHSRRSTRR